MGGSGGDSQQPPKALPGPLANGDPGDVGPPSPEPQLETSGSGARNCIIPILCPPKPGRSQTDKGRDRNAGDRSLATNKDEAVFWSGIRGGDERASEWATKNGGVTLESRLRESGIQLPTFDRNKSASVAAWENASREFAAGAQGDVRVLQEDAVRVTSVWARIEFPMLQTNAAVTSITRVDLRSGTEEIIWSRH